MIQRVHGIDRHKRSATISVMNREGKEIKFIRSCSDLNSYIQTLSQKNAVVFETELGSFYWADKIEETGAFCFIINPNLWYRRPGILDIAGMMQMAVYTARNSTHQDPCHMMNRMLPYFLFNVENNSMIIIQELTIGIDAVLCELVISK